MTPRDILYKCLSFILKETSYIIMELEARISAASSSGASFFTWFPIEASAKDARKFSSRQRCLGTRQRISVYLLKLSISPAFLFLVSC